MAEHDNMEQFKCHESGCTFTGSWAQYLTHALSHLLPHPDDRPAWLAARRTFIGASEIAAVCGLDQWATALDVFARKCLPPPEDDIAKPHAVRGLLFERMLLADFEKRHHTTLVRPATRRHSSFPWLAATPDGVTEHGDLVQIKTVNHRMAHGWEHDQPPAHVILQVQQEMAVFHASRCFVVALLGTDFLVHEFEVAFDAEAFASAAELASVFWHDAVVPRKLPTEFDGIPDDETLRALFPRVINAGLLPAPPAVVELGRLYAMARETANAADKDKDKIALELKLLIGEGEGFMWGSTKKPIGKITWKNQAPKVNNAALIEELLCQLGPDERATLLAKHTRSEGGRVLHVTIKDNT